MHDIDVSAIGTDELHELARCQLATWTRAARELLPEDPARVDAHCHLGLDIDGASITQPQLVEQLDEAGMHHALVTPLAQADGYTAENERLRTVASESGGRLHALHRCDPRAADPGADARLGLEDGAVGLKWHPRAERFTMHDDVARQTAAVADEHGVPILIHAGRGMERLGEGVVELARSYPRATFVLAHGAISDLAWILDATADVPNVVFDTSWWRPTDLLALLVRCPPARVIHGSDPPYGTAQMGVQITARIARACGWGDDAIRALMGGTARKLFAIGDAEQAFDLSAHAPSLPVEQLDFRRAGELLAAGLQVQFAQGDADEVFDQAHVALDVPATHERAGDAATLQGAIVTGRALIARGAPDQMWAPTSRTGTELLISTLVHLATPSLPIHRIDRVGCPEPAPFV